MARLLRQAVYERCPGMEIEVLAARAGVHRRTVYRWLRPKEPDMPLDTADRLLIAIGRDLNDVRLIDDPT